uniref:Amino acid transporter transmembrane domain-containing protein n=1 Tax=Zea mays TaxID=4577 RepID=B4FH05_MAIZE|nr:unknown [Zea mays]
MAQHHGSHSLEVGGVGAGGVELDDDGHAARTGNLWTCFAHIITAVIGCGVLALSWSVAQLGWVGGPVAMLCFAFVTYLSAFLLSHCYRSPASDDGSLKRQRNYTYMDAVRTHLVPQHVRDRNRLHHHHGDLSQGDREGQLLPQPGPQRSLRRRRRPPLHAALRGGPGGAVPHTQLPQHGLALRRRRRHVLHLRHHRPRPRPRQDHRKWGDQRKRRRSSDEHRAAESLASRAGHRRHRVRLPVHHCPTGDTGHAQIAATRERDDAEGERARGPGHHVLLPRRGVLRVRRLRQRCAGQPAHRLRLLRAVLAHRLRQRLHRAPPAWWLPDVQPADLHLRGPVLGGQVPEQRVREQILRREGARRAGVVELQPQPAAAVFPDGVRGEHHGAGPPLPLLQRGAGRAGRRRLLAPRHLPPRRDVLRPARGPAVDADVGRASGIQRRLLRRRHLRLRRLRRGSHPQEARLVVVLAPFLSSTMS